MTSDFIYDKIFENLIFDYNSISFKEYENC